MSEANDACAVSASSESPMFFYFFFNDTATTEIYTLSLHDALPILSVATSANGMEGLHATLVIDDPLMVKHLAALAAWQKGGLFEYAGRTTRGETKFINGDCGIFLGSSASRADFLAQAKFDVGFGLLPYWPEVAGAPKNSIIGGGSLWGDRKSVAEGKG